ncbi:Uncharacterised protein [Mycobacterium tuberculosis]|nr:Uncharacterised protein [Mycobacterium tuberculosis]
MISERADGTRHGMPCVWAADANHHIVFTREVRNDIAFALASVLPANEHVYTPDPGRCVQMQTGSDPHERVIRIGAFGVDTDIGIIF